MTLRPEMQSIGHKFPTPKGVNEGCRVSYSLSMRDFGTDLNGRVEMGSDGASDWLMAYVLLAQSWERSVL